MDMTHTLSEKEKERVKMNSVTKGVEQYLFM